MLCSWCDGIVGLGGNIVRKLLESAKQFGEKLLRCVYCGLQLLDAKVRLRGGLREFVGVDGHDVVDVRLIS